MTRRFAALKFQYAARPVLAQIGACDCASRCVKLSAWRIHRRKIRAHRRNHRSGATQRLRFMRVRSKFHVGEECRHVHRPHRDVHVRQHRRNEALGRGKKLRLHLHPLRQPDAHGRREKDRRAGGCASRRGGSFGNGSDFRFSARRAAHRRRGDRVAPALWRQLPSAARRLSASRHRCPPRRIRSRRDRASGRAANQGALY